MTKNDFVKLINNGSDIMFDVSGKHFTILTWLDEGIGIGEQQAPTAPQIFRTADELVTDFFVDGKSLSELSSQIVVTNYS